MADESNGSESNKEVNYVRKKNIISGVDNDFLLTLLGAGAITLGILNLPQVQEWVRNIAKGMPQLPNQQGQPANGQPQLVPPPPSVSPQVSLQAQPQMPKTDQQIRQEQQRYAEAVEQDGIEQGNQYNSFNALPERNIEESKDKKKVPYTPGSSVSAGY